MSSADRDARIAAAERNSYRNGFGEMVVNADDYAWLIAELRAALSREEEAKKDAERVNWLEQAVASADHEGGRCVVVIGAWYSSDTPSPDGYSVNVGELHVDPNEWANLREAIDCARSVSLSENG